MQKDMMLGSEAVAVGVKLSRPRVISAYPITPQTHIIERLSEMVDNGEIDASFIRVESELSAISAAMGASQAGVRAFTATSSHGLALMHEVLHWIVGARLPVVLVNANRAIGSPWNIWTDQSDSMSQRDLGWLQIYCETAQEALDTVLQAFYVSEKVLLPIMVMIDGFILSHTLEEVIVPGQKQADEFLPPYEPEYYLDVGNPMSFGNPAKGDVFYLLRKDIQRSMEASLGVAQEAHRRFEEIFGRKYDLVEGYRVDDARVVFAIAGALTGTVRVAVDRLREEGVRAGLLKIRYFRPFPKEEIKKLLRGVEHVIVLNRSLSFGSSGQIAQEIRDALYYEKSKPKVHDYILSLGGKEVFVEDIMRLGKQAKNLDISNIIWIS